MMLENKAGMKLLFKTGENGLTLPFFEYPQDIKVSFLSEIENNGVTTIVSAYEVLLWDCRGTDACGWNYL